MDFKKIDSVFIIAELSANHNGSLQIAIESIKAAKKAGADAVKLQTYTPDTMTLNSHQDDFYVDQGTIWDGNYLYDLYKKAYTPWDWHKKLFDTAKEEGIFCFSTPFDTTAVDFLETLDNPIYKIASPEITDISLIRYIALKGKPIIISTGISTEEDINLALKTCRDVGNKQIALLKCTTSYPAPIGEANLSMIAELRNRFGVVTGLSDHTLGIIAPVVAVSMGAKIIEKHFILNHDIGGPDSKFSLDKDEFSDMVKAVRQAEKSIGSVNYNLTESQKKSRNFSRSIYVVEDIKKGEKLTQKNIRSVRPGFGLHPRYLEQIIGKKVNADLKKGQRMDLKFIEKSY
jgi:pseudaminic acid synthase